MAKKRKKQRNKLATVQSAPLVSQKPTSKRAYAGAKSGRLMFSAGTSSADGELYTGLSALRNRSRSLVRDVVYAKRAKTVVVNNVIGPGVGLQGQVKNQRGRLLEKANSAIERAWDEWARAENCHTGGSLHFFDLERAAMGEVFEAGEVFIRVHPARFGTSEVPMGLELIESERIADDHEISPPSGNRVTMGVEHDGFGRPLAYWLRRYHREFQPFHNRTDEILRVPADEMFHLRLIDRWPQTRGVPWMHAAITRLNQLGEYEEAAVIAARIGASKVGFFENPEFPNDPMADGEEADGTPSLTVEAGEFAQLPPGYKFQGWDPNYPTDAFDPFTRACLRGIAAGTGPSYESLSRDYSQSNYSSSRLALLDDRDLWRFTQQWWVRNFREPLHRLWMQRAVMSKAISGLDITTYLTDTAKWDAVKFKPRGWSWVDPTKEVSAYKEAEKAGYITKADIIAATAGGQDLEDVLQGRRRELDMLSALDIQTDTTSPASPEPSSPVPAPDSEEEDQQPRLYAFGGKHG